MESMLPASAKPSPVYSAGLARILRNAKVPVMMPATGITNSDQSSIAEADSSPSTPLITAIALKARY